MKRERPSQHKEVNETRHDLTVRYLERTGIPQKHGLTGEKVLEIVNDCAQAVRVLSDTAAHLKTSH